MPRVAFAERALSDLERIVEFLAVVDPAAANAAVETILDAISILERHPQIGRPAEGQLRELVIGIGATGFVAMYRLRPRSSRVEILTIRHQREAGYA